MSLELNTNKGFRLPGSTQTEEPPLSSSKVYQKLGMIQKSLEKLEKHFKLHKHFSSESESESECES